jgi:hypothetical protein
MNDLFLTLAKGLEGDLDNFKFIKSRRLLQKTFLNGWQGIAISLLKTSNPEVMKLSAYAQIRIDELENLYTPHHTFMSAKDSKVHPTLTANCDSLLTDKSLANGFQIDDSNVSQFIERYSAAIQLDIIPWLEKHSTEDGIYKGLSDSNPLNWVTSDRLTRYPVLLSILAKRSDWDAFEFMATEFLEYCDKPHAQVYKSLATSIINGLKGA